MDNDIRITLRESEADTLVFGKLCIGGDHARGQLTEIALAQRTVSRFRLVARKRQQLLYEMGGAVDALFQGIEGRGPLRGIRRTLCKLNLQAERGERRA